jgi:hypothetical protein
MTCDFCGREFEPDKFHNVAHHTPHCDDKFCIEACDECQDWIASLGEPDPVKKPQAEKPKEPTDRPVVVLTNDEWEKAILVAGKKTIQNHSRGATNKDGIDIGRAWDASVEGDCGEAAFAKWMGIPWDGSIGDYAAVDVGGKYQVKTTGTEFLIIRKRDPDTGIYVSMKGRSPRYEVVGWMTAQEAKNEKYWCDKYNNGRPAYFVPFGDLKDINILRKEKP